MNKPDSKYFCILPWLHMNVMPDSSVLPCCVSPYDQPFGSGKSNSINEIINSHQFNQLRKNMLNEKPSASCSKCYELEQGGFRSIRKEMNMAFQNHFDQIEKTNLDGSIQDFKLRYVDIRFSNLCNLKCRGCGPTLSSAWYEDHQIVYNYKSENEKVVSVSSSAPHFWEELKSRLNEAEIVYFGGGEPLITKEHFEVLQLLRSLKKFDVKLTYNTNLSQLNYGNYNLNELWDEFKHVSLSISIDDIFKRGEYYRHGTKWEVIEKNLNLLLNKHPKIERNINCTVNIMNVFYLPEILNYFIQNKYVELENIFLNILLNPIEYRIDTLPKEFKSKVTTKLKKYCYFLDGLKLKNSRLINEIENTINFMNKEDNSENLQLFKKTTAALDKIRNESFEKVYPELKSLLI